MQLCVFISRIYFSYTNVHKDYNTALFQTPVFGVISCYYNFYPSFMLIYMSSPTLVQFALSDTLVHISLFYHHYSCDLASLPPKEVGQSLALHVFDRMQAFESPGLKESAEATFVQSTRHNVFRKPSKPCHVGIHWIALSLRLLSDEYPCARGLVTDLSGFCIVLYWPN